MRDKLTEVKLDYDLPWRHVLAIFRKRGWLLKRLGLQTLLVYSTKRGYHVYALLSCKMRDYEILLTQSLMDSDPNREILNFLRKKKTGNMRNFLFDMKSFYTNDKRKSFRLRKRKKWLESRLKNIIQDNEVKL